MLGLIRLILGPALLWQGRRVRRGILRLPEADGPRDGVAGEGPDFRLLILGDSSAAGVGARHQDQALAGQLVKRLARARRVSWQLVAETGWTTADGAEALTAVESRPLDLVVIALGVNDVTTETSLASWQAQYAGILDDLCTRFGAAHVIASGMPPMGRFPALPQPLRWYLGQRAAKIDQALGELAKQRTDVTHLPLVFDLDTSAMAEDGFHPGPLVYADWAEQVASLTASPA